MIPDPDRRTPGPTDVVHYEAGCVVRIHDRAIPAHADLTGGRDHHSVGGEITEGPRWWRGRIDWPREEAAVQDGSEIIIELDDGRCGPAIIGPDPAAPEHSRAVHGIGPPPFDVP